MTSAYASGPVVAGFVEVAVPTGTTRMTGWTVQVCDGAGQVFCSGAD
ncbi:hypothetical protein [Thioclava sp. A2]|nr:hypothetical protein [Thioclava sp. A2]